MILARNPCAQRRGELLRPTPAQPEAPGMTAMASTAEVGPLFITSSTKP